MGQATLVEEFKKDGETLIERLIAEGISVTAACWLKETDSGLWYLYLATPLVGDEGGTRQAYRQIGAVERQIATPLFIDSGDVKAIRPNSSIAKAVIEMQRSFPGRNFPVGEGQFGDLSIDGGYIYAPLRATAHAG